KRRYELLLVEGSLKPIIKPPRPGGKETCQRCLEVLQRCGYLDKDLVLPPMTTDGSDETFLVVACTDMKRAEIMMTRIREQLGKLTNLESAGELRVSAQAVPLPDIATGLSLQDQVREVAVTVIEMVRTALAGNSRLAVTSN